MDLFLKKNLLWKYNKHCDWTVSPHWICWSPFGRKVNNVCLSSTFEISYWKTLLQCLSAFSKTIPVWLWQVPPKHIEEDFDYIQQVSVSLVVFGQQLYFYQVGYHWSMLKTNMGNLEKCTLPSRSISNRCLSFSIESLWVWANYQTPSKPPAASGSL